MTRDTDLDCDGVLAINEQVDPVVARYTLNADEVDVLRIDDLADEVGGRLVDVDEVSATGATAVIRDGGIVYSPAAGFVGVDRLRARLSQGWWELEVVVTVSVSRPDQPPGTAARTGGNDVVDASVLTGGPADPATVAAASRSGSLAVTGPSLPSRPAVLVALVLLIVLWAGMSWTVRG